MNFEINDCVSTDEPQSWRIEIPLRDIMAALEQEKMRIVFLHMSDGKTPTEDASKETDAHLKQLTENGVLKITNPSDEFLL